MELIQKYFAGLTSQQTERFSELEGLYNEWNAKINVISRSDIDELYTRHVLHSLAIAKFISFKPGTSIVDVGCGGGFPGIPLAIMFPDVQFTLVDSIGKKIKVVNEVSAGLGLGNVTAINERAEKLRDRYDFVISRAVTQFPRFVALTRKLVSNQQKNSLPNGIIYLKGGDFEEELAGYLNKVQVINISDFFEEPFFETKKVIYLPLK
ncbi:MAG: 16S rRNA (guanine(527)-N(7))-methyltransferase RsmG [Prolixibacteraceae bacterium]|nr:16S rRNA (guanine(527)-N(7))-methyltransferase RsmG [Prolixibacteraceae bacterium]